MYETTSVTIRYNHRILMKEIIDIYMLTKKYHAAVTFSHNQHTVSGVNLPKLVTFFLTMKRGSHFLVVIDGIENHLLLNQLRAVFEKAHSCNHISKSISFQHPIHLE